MVNQTIFHDEVEVYRVAIVPGGITHPILGAIPDKGCIPLPVTKTGTMSTVNTDASTPTGAGLTVLGTGTSFKSDSDFQPGRFLVNADGVCRRIKEVNSDTMIILVNKFPASLTGVDVKLVTFKPGMITAKSVGSADAIMQEQDFVVGESFVGGGSPLSYDASAVNSQIDFSIHV